VSDELEISGGGSTAVATGDLFMEAARLGATEAVVADWISRAAVIRRGLEGLGLPEGTSMWDRISPAEVLGFADLSLNRAHDRAASLRTSLIEAAERYGATERTIDGMWRLGAVLSAPWIGMALVSPAVLAGGVLAAAGQWAGSKVWQVNGLGPTPIAAWLAENRELLSDPAFVRALRVAADHADEVAAGTLHLPLPVPVIAALGAGVGAPENAAALLGLTGMLGLVGSRVLVDGPVRVDRSSTHTVDPPEGIGDLADRVPSGGADAAQIRIERYGDGDDVRWIVYVGGTIDVGLVAGEQTHDMTSNLHGIADDSELDELRLAGADSGAGERAVREAMQQAGVRQGDPLLAVGYSGGGVIAAKLAADPELNAVGAVNLGGPVASAPTREGVGVLSIEHEEDLVPVTGGSGHPSDERVTVSRSVLEQGTRYESLLPAHELARYRDTAAAVDGSDEARLAEFCMLVGEVTGDSSATRSDWIATRDLSSSTTDGR
jgi:hypothetical protein